MYSNANCALFGFVIGLLKSKSLYLLVVTGKFE